jgi:hypothetical protein
MIFLSISSDNFVVLEFFEDRGKPRKISITTMGRRIKIQVRLVSSIKIVRKPRNATLCLQISLNEKLVFKSPRWCNR